MSDTLVKVENVSKKFCRSRPNVVQGTGHTDLVVCNTCGQCHAPEWLQSFSNVVQGTGHTDLVVCNTCGQCHAPE